MSNTPIKPATTHGPLLPCLSRTETSHLLGHQWQHLRDGNGRIPDYLGCINTLQIVRHTTYWPVEEILQSYHIKPYHFICKPSTYPNKLSKHQIRSSLTNSEHFKRQLAGYFLWYFHLPNLGSLLRIWLDSSCKYSTLQKTTWES